MAHPRSQPAELFPQKILCVINLVSRTGFKPAPSCFGDRRSYSTELPAHLSFSGMPETRTQPSCLQGKYAARNTCNPHLDLIRVERFELPPRVPKTRMLAHYTIPGEAKDECGMMNDE